MPSSVTAHVSGTGLPLEVCASGMITGVGLTTASSCAAMRCSIDNFEITRFRDLAGEWLVGSSVPLTHSWRGLERLVHLAVPAISECLAHVPGVSTRQIPVLLCVAERERPHRVEDVEERLFSRIETELGARFHELSALVPLGRVAAAAAVSHARALIHGERLSHCLVVGVDSLLVGPTLVAYEKGDRLLTSTNSNGFIPGEAAAAVLLSAPGIDERPRLCLIGQGTGSEPAPVASTNPLRADGLTQAIKAALAEAGRALGDVSYRISDANGEQYWFKEGTLALTRTLRTRRERFEIWHPADCIGEIGAAAGACAIAVALTAARKGYAPGDTVLCHSSADDERRAALIFETVHAGRH
jgi:3-oxoacyl-[acyl-carrier-protein] synthase I